MASLSLKHIYKVYDNGFKAVNDFTMDIEDKEFIVFVGPSGCGKSTTLRMIAGLEEITAGELMIGDSVVNNYAPKDRDIAMVFQSYALYPHMTVYNNIAYSLKIKGVNKEEIDRRVREAARILNITEYLDRKPRALSGGQRQRVSLGRAIVRNPKVFLLDEPLSNLDAKLRASMRSEITKLHQKLNTTFIYVTHDQIEAMTMGTRIVVMKNGFIQQIDTPSNIYNHPANKFVAGFIGTPQMNFYDATYEVEGKQVYLNLGFARIRLLEEYLYKMKRSEIVSGKKVIVGIRPESIALYNEAMKPSVTDVLDAKVSIVEALGSETIVYADLNLEKDTDESIVTDVSSEIRIKMLSNFTTKVGDIIKVGVNLNDIHLFDAETEESLVRRVPEEFEVKATLQENKLSFLGNEINLYPELISNLEEGHLSAFVPTHEVKLGNDYKGAVYKVEEVDNDYLYWIKIKDDIVFYRAPKNDEKVFNVKDEISVDIPLASLKLVGKTTCLDRINLVADLPVTAKLISKKDLVFVTGTNEIPVPFDMAQKLFNTKGKSLLKTKLSLAFNTNNESDITIKAIVTEIKNYDVPYAKVSYLDHEFYVLSKEYQVGQEIDVHIALEEAMISDVDNGIILLGTTPKDL